MHPRRFPIVSLCLAALSQACASAPLQSDPIVLNDDGGWCWFQDERALALGDWIVMGSVAAGHHDSDRKGNVELTHWNPSSGAIVRTRLNHQLQRDDHNAPALLALDSGGLLATYAKHGSDKLMRWRHTSSSTPEAIWSTEESLALPKESTVGVTYANLHHDRKRNRILNLFRGLGWDPNLTVSVDGGRSWEWAGRVLGGPGRPYLQYTSDGSGDVHMVATEQHPRDYDNGLYHGVLRGLEVCNSEGEALGRVGAGPPLPSDLTEVFEGSPEAVAWPVDVELDPRGQPVILFSVQRDGAGQPRGKGGLDHAFRWAQWIDGQWQSEFVAHAGTRLYAGEDDYTGLAALDTADPNVVYLSTDAHPLTGEPLISATDQQRHRELFVARRGASGSGWSFEALTRNSTHDNLRPILPKGNPRVLLWLRGKLNTYTQYDLEVVGIELD